MDQRTLRVGAAVIACAVLLRLISSGVLQPVVQALSQPEVARVLLYLETGRVVRSTPAAETTAPTETVPEESAAEASPIQPPVFTAEDTARVSITYNCGYRPDIEALLTQTLDWDLTGEEPTVLILHTHTTESYTQTENSTYEESSAFRTLEEACNMLAVGDRVAETLEAGGISVIHDRTFHDYPSYSGSYAASRETVETYLKE